MLSSEQAGGTSDSYDQSARPAVLVVQRKLPKLPNLTLFEGGGSWYTGIPVVGSTSRLGRYLVLCKKYFCPAIHMASITRVNRFSAADDNKFPCTIRDAPNWVCL